MISTWLMETVIYMLWLLALTYSWWIGLLRRLLSSRSSWTRLSVIFTVCGVIGLILNLPALRTMFALLREGVERKLRKYPSN